MEVYASGELVWDTTEADAPRWILVLHGQPSDAPGWLDPCDASTPHTASVSQCVELISRTLHQATGQRPVSVTVTPVQYRQRLRFHATF